MNNKARPVALGGIAAALIAVCLYAAAIFPTGRLGFYFLAVFMPVMPLMEGYRAGALLSAGAAALLMFFVLPNKLVLLPYICFLGWYPVLRDCLVGKRMLTARIILQVAFNAGAALWLFLSAKLFGFDPAALFGGSVQPWLWVVIALAAQVVFVVADIFFGLCVEAYRTRIHSRVFKN